MDGCNESRVWQERCSLLLYYELSCEASKFKVVVDVLNGQLRLFGGGAMKKQRSAVWALPRVYVKRAPSTVSLLLHFTRSSNSRLEVLNFGAHLKN
jgi:hypothetical protein